MFRRIITSRSDVPETIIAPYAIPQCWIPPGARVTADPRLPDVVIVTHSVRRDQLEAATRLAASAGDAAPHPGPHPPSRPERPDRTGRPHLRLIP